MYAWEKAFQFVVENLREKEAALTKSMLKLQIFGTTFSESSVYFCMFVTCAVYTSYGQGILTPEKVYTSFMILGFIKLWSILFFQFGAMFMINAQVMKKRIVEILLIQDVLPAISGSNAKSNNNDDNYNGSI